jgi:hypothetical protein
MPISASLTVTPAAPNHGDTVTAVYSVQGNNAVPPASDTVSGDVHVGDQDLAVSTSVTLPGEPALPETFAVPTCPGLTFAADPADPTGATFTALVP